MDFYSAPAFYYLLSKLSSNAFICARLVATMKCLVVGAGYWGPNIVRNLVSFPEVEMVGVSDLDFSRAQSCAARFPKAVAVSPAPQVFTEGYDAVFIVTPVATHATLAEAALRAGLHVFLEKPITSTVAEATTLVDLARVSRKVLMVGHVFHYKPEVQKIAELVASGALGAIRYLDSVRINLGVFREDVSVLWDLAPHDISIFEAVLGGKQPLRVSAIAASHIPHPIRAQPSMAHLTLDYGEQCLGHVHVNWFSPLKQRLMVIAGDKQMLVYDDMDMQEPIKVYDRGTYDPQEDTPAYPLLRTGDTMVPFVKPSEPLSRELQEFFSAIRDRRICQTDGEAGKRVVRILEAADKSIKEDGRFVPLE